MRVLIGSGDTDVVGALGPAFADDVLHVADLAPLTEPDAVTTVEAASPDAVVLVPDWTAGPHQLRGCWWLARAGQLAHVPVVLCSTAAVFDGGDRRPRTEFDRPAPDTDAGRLADAAEQLVRWTTRRAVIVRTGPLDHGAWSAAALAGTDPQAVVTGLTVTGLGPRLRALAVGRRYGVWHLVAGTAAAGELAQRYGVAGRAPAGEPEQRVAPPPLTSLMVPMAQDVMPSGAGEGMQ